MASAPTKKRGENVGVNNISRLRHFGVRANVVVKVTFSFKFRLAVAAFREVLVPSFSAALGP